MGIILILPAEPFCSSAIFIEGSWWDACDGVSENNSRLCAARNLQSLGGKYLCLREILEKICTEASRVPCVGSPCCWLISCVVVVWSIFLRLQKFKISSICEPANRNRLAAGARKNLDRTSASPSGQHLCKLNAITQAFNSPSITSLSFKNIETSSNLASHSAKMSGSLNW